MNKRAELEAELVQVALAIEEDLQRLEDLAGSVSKLRLNTEKNIGRAARTLQEALEAQQQLAHRLTLLAQAMTHMQQRQQAAIGGLGARAAEIQAQHTRLGEHMQRFGELGKRAAEVTQALAGTQAPEGAGAGGSVPALASVQDQLAELSQQAKDLAASADATDLSEVAREANALRQRVDAARARLGQILEARQAQAN